MTKILNKDKNNIGQPTKNRIGPIYIGDLNQQFIDSTNFTIVEDIYLNENGSGTIIAIAHILKKYLNQMQI